MTFTLRTGASLAFSMMSMVLTTAPVFAQCKESTAAVVPMSAVIGQGGYLSSDGRGAYVDATQGAQVNLHNAANLVAIDINKNARSVVFNLNGPVAGDPLAQPLGIVQDRQGAVHVLYTLDPVGPDGLRQLRSLQELPDDGVFYTSERTDLYVNIGGVRHLLMFGGDTYPINGCTPTGGAVFSAAGTTKLQVARLPGTDTYVLQAPAGSVARLFDYSNTFAPIDKGLYKFSFSVTFSPKPKKGR